MDVTCEQCKAEYDFDDTLLGDKGTTVKCSKCGHVFRVLPPRREPQRSSLKVRFARDGHVEPVSSLRELQQRIQAGHVSVDDELGRDGFNYRRLGDVPELKNFFPRGQHTSTLPPPSPAALAAQAPGAPGKVAPKRTVLGLGPAGDVPPAPRVPNFGYGQPAQAAPPTSQAPATPSAARSPQLGKATMHGRAPISSAPTAPNLSIPTPEPRSQPAPRSALPTPSGTAPTVQASPLAVPPSALASTPNREPAPSGKPATSPPGTRPVAPSSPSQAAPVPAQPSPLPAAPSAQPAPRLRIPDSVPPSSLQAPAARGMPADSMGPGALRAAAQQGPVAATAPSGRPAVRLSLDEDDAPVERPSKSSAAKPVLYVGVLLALGAGGWLAASKLSQEAPSAAAVTPTPEPAAAANTEQPDAALEAIADANPAAEGEDTPEPSQAAAPGAVDAAAASTPAAPPSSSNTSSSAKSSAGAREPKEREPAESSASAREPKDYSGWVARGEQLFSRGDMSGAKQAFESAVNLRGSGSEANSGLGSVLVAMGQTREALPYLSRAANNGFAEASVALGDAYRKLGQKDEAIEAYETYLARMPKGARANYVRLQLEGLGRGASKASRREEDDDEPSSPPPGPSEYRPAGELTEPSAPAPSREPSESETAP